MYNKVYQYPDWAVGIGWTLALASMICIPMVVVIKIIRSDGPLIEVGESSIGLLFFLVRLTQINNGVFFLPPCRGLKRWPLRFAVGPAPVPQTIVALRSLPTHWTPMETRAS